MRLIDADKLKEHIDKLPALPDGNFAGNHSALKALINMQQTIEPERKKGKWIYDGDCYICNQCKSAFSWWADSQTSNYCPNCGADMRGESDGQRNDADA